MVSPREVAILCMSWMAPITLGTSLVPFAVSNSSGLRVPGLTFVGVLFGEIEDRVEVETDVR